MAILLPNYQLARKIGSNIEIEAKTVRELIKICRERYGEPFNEALKTVSLLVNGVRIQILRGTRTKLRSHDSVWMFKLTDDDDDDDDFE